MKKKITRILLCVAMVAVIVSTFSMTAFAAGDVAGGCPQKYVTGALAEGEIAAQAVLSYLYNLEPESEEEKQETENVFKQYEEEYEQHLQNTQGLLTTEQLEEAMQKVMDEYAGGIATGYRYNESRLNLAAEKITSLQKAVPKLHAEDMDDLLRIYEVR